MIGHSPSADFSDTVSRTSRALSEFRISGVETNIPFLQNLLRHPEFIAGRFYTRFVYDHIAELTAVDDEVQQRRLVESGSTAAGYEHRSDTGLAGANIDSDDPLALFSYDKKVKAAQSANKADRTPRPLICAAPMGLSDCQPRYRVLSSASTWPRAIRCAGESNS